jgi:hypothetical protein
MAIWRLAGLAKWVGFSLFACDIIFLIFLFKNSKNISAYHIVSQNAVSMYPYLLGQLK